MALHKKDIEELTTSGVIDEPTARAITAYYASKKTSSDQTILTIFGLIGAILVGLGTILILAHNWDSLGKLTKTIIAFCPLLLAQLIGYYTLHIRPTPSTGWKEGSAAFLTLTVGAGIALISQIYHLQGSLAGFLWLWIILVLAVVYLFESTFVALLIIIGASVYMGETGYNYLEAQQAESYWYWIFIGALVPYYIICIKKRPAQLGTILLHWAFPISILHALGTFHDNHSIILFLAFALLLGTFYVVGHLKWFGNLSIVRNGYLTIGSLGMFIIFMIGSFRSFWKEIQEEIYFGMGSEWIVSILVFIVFLCLLIVYLKDKKSTTWKPILFAPLLYTIIFLFGGTPESKALLMNIMIFALGIVTVRLALREDHFGILNYGLLIITVLIICRFFDTNISFIIRGLLFVLVGIGFFAANYRMIKARKNEKHV